MHSAHALQQHCRVAKFYRHEDGIRDTSPIRPLARLVILLAMGRVEGSGQSHGSRPQKHGEFYRQNCGFPRIGRQSSSRHKLKPRPEKQEANLVTMNGVRSKENICLEIPRIRFRQTARARNPGVPAGKVSRIRIRKQHLLCDASQYFGVDPE
ncbi:hypothetical protein H113_06880 [Trichophyton rubrum MR1459]|uniref:Uncharacterized protein n=1 Tax=Trichophyton rubrum CBS 288.86 TaxID=1215330 RepID=A0A022VV88_TRIRU|nr:hypothetical protein H103_06832 [Trichophyton rubrum CBS 288.86]EZF92274.1 hypothetical protein H113_06880 [Trichophyton rubrum MR1459]